MAVFRSSRSSVVAEGAQADGSVIEAADDTEDEDELDEEAECAEDDDEEEDDDDDDDEEKEEEEAALTLNAGPPVTRGTTKSISGCSAGLASTFAPVLTHTCRGSRLPKPRAQGGRSVPGDAPSRGA